MASRHATAQTVNTSEGDQRTPGAIAPGWMDHQLESELVLPEQFFGGARIDASISPEKRFILAVLEQAVRDFCREVTATDPRRRREFDEVEAWFASEEIEWPCSFLNVCDTLELDASWLRSRLWTLRDRQRARPDDPPSRIPAFRRRTGTPRRSCREESRVCEAA